MAPSPPVADRLSISTIIVSRTAFEAEVMVIETGSIMVDEATIRLNVVEVEYLTTFGIEVSVPQENCLVVEFQRSLLEVAVEQSSESPAPVMVPMSRFPVPVAFVNAKLAIVEVV